MAYKYTYYFDMLQQKYFNRILIIDDDDTIIRITRYLLADMTIAEQLLTAKNGLEGLEQIKTHFINENASSATCPDVIMIDINMPILSGMEVVEELDKIIENNLIQAKVVVLVTSFLSPALKTKLFPRIKYFIEKPVTESKILELIGD